MNGVKPRGISSRHLYKTHIAAGESDSEFWHREEQGERCEHNGLVEDCEIAVCQGKTERPAVGAHR